MKLIDIMTSPWAIEAEKLLEISSIYEAHVRGEKIDIPAVEARLGRPLAREEQGYEVRENVAIVPIEGVIAQRANLFMRISGGASSQLIERDIRGALADSAVRAILLSIDSPGGTVWGTQELADLIDRAREEKPVATWSSGHLCSAAYWIGAAADRVYVSGDLVFAGNIGIVATHVDRSKQQEMLGMKTTEIVAGRYKRLASEFRPLAKEGAEHMQEMVDYLYSVFVGDVAAYRGVTVERVLADMADGRVFIGRQALDAGLVDGVATLDEVVALLSEGRMPRRGPTRKQPLAKVSTGGAPGKPDAAAAAHEPAAAGDAGAAGAEAGGGDPRPEAKEDPSIDEGATMDKITKERIIAECPELADLFRAEGAAAERTRIQGVEAAGLPGHEELIAKLKFDGKTTPGDAALAVNAAERAKLGGKARDLAADAAALAAAKPAASAAGAEKNPDPAADASKPVEERCKAAWDSDAAIRAEFISFENYLAFEKNSARVRVLGGRKAA